MNSGIAMHEILKERLKMERLMPSKKHAPRKKVERNGKPNSKLLGTVLDVARSWGEVEKEVVGKTYMSP